MDPYGIITETSFLGWIPDKIVGYNFDHESNLLILAACIGIGQVLHRAVVDQL